MYIYIYIFIPDRIIKYPTSPDEKTGDRESQQTVVLSPLHGHESGSHCVRCWMLPSMSDCGLLGRVSHLVGLLISWHCCRRREGSKKIDKEFKFTPCSIGIWHMRLGPSRFRMSRPVLSRVEVPEYTPAGVPARIVQSYGVRQLHNSLE